MQNSGVIRGAHADIDLRAVGLMLEALFFIELAKHERAVVDRFMSETESIPEVRRAFLVSGHYDLVVHVAVKDIEHLRNLAFDRFTSQPVVVKIETSIVFDSRTRNELPIPRDGVKEKLRLVKSSRKVITAYSREMNVPSYRRTLTSHGKRSIVHLECLLKSTARASDICKASRTSSREQLCAICSRPS